MKHLSLTLVVALLCAGSVYAHHSFSSFYQERESVSIEGDLVSFEYKAPHAWVHIMAKDETGQMQKFSAEWQNPRRLKEMGIQPETFKPGERYTLTGSPGRNPADHLLHLKVIQRVADGKKWGNGGRR